MNVKIINRSDNPLPRYETPGSSGVDLYSNNDQPIKVSTNEIVKVPTGLFLEIPLGYEAQIRSRSGMTLKHGIVVANGIGTIDSDYRGEICVLITNISKEDYTIQKGERIAQMVFAKVEQLTFELCDTISDTQRGDGGFGHTGK